MNVLAGRLLRIPLVVLLLGSAVAQVLVPVLASEVGARFPEVASLVVPSSVAAILFMRGLLLSAVANRAELDEVI
jgi:hypothetical protein